MIIARMSPTIYESTIRNNLMLRTWAVNRYTYDICSFISGSWRILRALNLLLIRLLTLPVFLRFHASAIRTRGPWFLYLYSFLLFNAIIERTEKFFFALRVWVLVWILNARWLFRSRGETFKNIDGRNAGGSTEKNVDQTNAINGWEIPTIKLWCAKNQFHWTIMASKIILQNVGWKEWCMEFMCMSMLSWVSWVSWAHADKNDQMKERKYIGAIKIC